MKHENRALRLNILLAHLPRRAEEGDTDARLDQWEAVIVRATAKITGLTADIIDTAISSLQSGGTVVHQFPFYEWEDRLLEGLRRYAELAK